MRLGFLASREGTTVQAVLDACRDGKMPHIPALVVSNNANSGVLRRAQAAGVPALHISGKTHADADAVLCAAFAEAKVDMVLCAGYMKCLGPKLLQQYAGRLINTHPSLLPKFGGKGMYGHHVHEAVLAAGETVSGATLHHVSGPYDTGRIIAQCRVPVRADDTPETLAARVQAAEKIQLVQQLAKQDFLLPQKPKANVSFS